MPIQEVKVKPKFTLNTGLWILSGLVMVTLLVLVFYFSITRKPEYILKYATVIDCGSSGSRIHLFQWKEIKGSKLLPEIERVRYQAESVIRKVKIPLSSFENTPEESVQYLKNLIDQIYTFIPDGKGKDVDLYIFATGGMRDIDENKANEIMRKIKSLLPNQINFNLKKAEIISGKMEGIYMWISLNYSLQKFQKMCGGTSDMIEMGGASTQIAFETSKNKIDSLEFSYICGKDNQRVSHYIYSVTFLGLGINKAYDIYKDEILKNNENLVDHCMAKECIHTFNSLQFTGDGNQNACLEKVRSAFSKYFSNEKISQTFIMLKERLNLENQNNVKEMFALSSFNYAFRDFIHFSGPLLPDMYWPRTQEFCMKECAIHKINLDKGLYNTQDEKYLLLQCFRVPFMRYVLEQMFTFYEAKPVINYSGYQGDPIDYTLGALIYIISN